VWIDSLRIEGGMLNGLDQHFDPHLNVLIGGRGTGKSSVIELMRFCLGGTFYTETGQEQSTEHALGVLGDGRVTVIVTDGRQRIEVSRTAQEDTSDLAAPVVNPFVFSQSEIETIGLQAQSRLRLIDGFLPPRQAQFPARTSIAARVRSATSEIRAVLAEIDDIAEKTAELPKLQVQLEAVKAQSAAQSKVHAELQRYRATLEELTPLVAAARVRTDTIGRVTDPLLAWSEQLADLMEHKPTIAPWPTQAETSDELTDLRKRETKAVQLLRAGLEEISSIVSELDKKRTAASSQRTGLENRAREIRQRIEEIQKGASALDKRIGDLTQQISVLKSLVGLRSERRGRLTTLAAQRSRLLDQLESVRNNLTGLRQQASRN
jgi:chromosome segregation ATPase